MIIEFLITFRETFEALLIIGIMLSYLQKIDQARSKKYVILGAMLGVILSILGALLVQLILGDFEGQIEKLFEGFLMIFSALLITTVLIWLHRQSNAAQRLQQKTSTAISKNQSVGLFFLAVISVVREGIETILFLSATSIVNGTLSTIGAIFGIITAIVLGFLVYKGAIHLNLKVFFNATAVILVFIAAGLMSYGLHELQEAGWFPTLLEHLYDINFLIDEKSPFGSFLNTFLGYNGNPSFLESITYIVYLGGALGVYFGIKPHKRAFVQQKNAERSTKLI